MCSQIKLTFVVFLMAACCRHTNAQQFQLDFDPPRYTASPVGIPLDGQDGWVVTQASAGTTCSEAWRVYLYSDNQLGIVPVYGGFESFAGTTGESSNAVADRGIFMSKQISFLAAIIRYDECESLIEYGRLELRPVGFEEPLAIHFSTSKSSETCGLEIEFTYYDKDDVAHRSHLPGLQTDALKVNQWYSFTMQINSLNQVIDIWIVDPTTQATYGHKPADWYLPGGAAVSSPHDSALRLVSSLSADDPVALAIDSIADSYICEISYLDCDRNGTKNIFDFLCFSSAFVSNLPFADCDESGSFSVFDYICFQSRWCCGCP